MNDHVRIAAARTSVRVVCSWALMLLGWVVVIPTIPFVLLNEIFWSLSERLQP